MQLEVKTVLNRIQHFVGFVYQDVRLCSSRGKLRIEARIEPHGGIRARCSECCRPAPGYDRLPERWWLFVPQGLGMGAGVAAASRSTTY